MSYFGLKRQIFLKYGEWGIKYFKPKGRQKSLEGRMWPAGRTLAMSAISDNKDQADSSGDLLWTDSGIW